MRAYKIAAIPGDGIGPEVINAGLEVLALCAKRDGFALEVAPFDWGSDYYRKHGVMMPPDGLTQLRGIDAIYFGAVGAPDIPDHITLWGLRSRSARGSINTPTCARHACSRGSAARCASPASSIG